MSVQPVRRSIAAAAPMVGGAERLETLGVPHIRARGDAVVVITRDRSMTYRQIDQHATAIAERLRRRGTGPGKLVAVVLDKGWEQVTAVLGVLRTGAAFVPIDPAMPPARLGWLLDHTSAALAVTTARIEPWIAWPEGVARIIADALSPSAPIDPVATFTAFPADDLAYIIYTSGSTGLPKGVMIPHQGAVNTILDVNERFGVSARDRVLAVSSLTFDLAIYDIFGLLAAGGAIVMPDPRAGADPAHWVDLLRRHEVTIWNSVPALMKMVVEYLERRGESLPGSLRLVMLSGDWIPVSLPDRIRALQPTARVVSLGGATEASIWSILYPVGTVDPSWRSIPYGHAMLNQSFYVLGDDFEPCATGTTGHLYIGGIGLARGYWRDREKTAASFVTNPRTGERLYRTGDLGRFLPDGEIEFLGRDDFQVKVQGYRIELGEIEAVLSRHESVRDVVVIAHGEDRGDKRLAAYVVPRDESVIDAAALRAFLAGQLPAYLIPAVFVPLTALPLNSNGKIDRRALPDPPAARETIREADTSLAGDVRSLVAGLIGDPSLDAETNLLELGITSVDIVRIVNALDEHFGSRPNVADFLREPTVAALEEFYRARHQGPCESSADPSTRAHEGDGDLSSVTPRHEDRPFVPLLPESPCEAGQDCSTRGVTFETFSSVLARVGAAQGQCACAHVYVHVNEDGVDGLAPGAYAYEPVEHQLVVLSADGDRPRRAAAAPPSVTRPRAFSIYLVADEHARASNGGADPGQTDARLVAALLADAAGAHRLSVQPLDRAVFDGLRAAFLVESDRALVRAFSIERRADAEQSHEPRAS